MADTIQPVLVGAGQTVDRPSELAHARSPLTMMYDSACASAEDAGLKPDQFSQLDVLAVVDTVGPSLMNNPPGNLAKLFGANDARQYLSTTGGNTPQTLVNHFSTEITAERSSMVLLTGAEVLDSLSKSAKTGQVLNWDAQWTGEDEEPLEFSPERPGSNSTEVSHGMVAPIVTYPFFENALRHHYGRSLQEHQLAIGSLLAPFTKVAKDNPNAWFPTERSAQEIAEPTRENRYIGFPYTKYMNAVMQVNQSASVLMMSDVKARSLGIDESRWVYLHGHCDVSDIWNVTERLNFHSSPALELGLSTVMEMAQTSADELNHFDIYSCFPAVVEITRDILGMKADDPRCLTVTGGLPYFGGAGNNYSMHAIASMMDDLRQTPGEFGLVTANGWYLTKHALGVYSTQRPVGPFARPEVSQLDNTIANLDHPTIEPAPEGRGKVETFTVMFDREGQPEQGLVIGSLASGKRFVAGTRGDQTLLRGMISEEVIGAPGVVSSNGTTNLFEFD